MSTILKALKKSQQERDRGTVPTLSRAPELAATPRARLWAWWAGGALALNAALLAIFVWWLNADSEFGEAAANAAWAEPAPAPWPLEVARTAPQATPGPIPDPPGNPAGPGPDPGPAPPPSSQAALAPPEPDPVPVAPAPVASAPVAPAPVAPAPVAPATVEPQTDVGASLASRPPPRLPPSPEPKPNPAPPLRTAVEPPASPPIPPRAVANLPGPPPARVAPLAVAPPKAPTPEPEPDPYASLPVLFQLPHEIQQAIPELSITVHVYDKDPDYRFVIMKRRKYREGDQLGRDLILEAIAPGGLVLRYQGTTFWFDF